MGRFFLLLFLLAAGLGAAWGVCHFITPCYEARCECEVAFGQSAEGGFEENLNTRLATWQAELQGAWQIFCTSSPRTIVFLTETSVSLQQCFCTFLI